MFIKRLFVIGALMLSMLAGTSWAETSKRALEIMNEVKVVGGHIDQKTHAEFWSELKKSVQPDPDGSKLKDLENTLKDVTLSNLSFPLEGWRSAKLSFEQHKVVKTPELVRKTAVLKPQAAFAKAIASTDQLIEAAATGKPLSRDGRTVYINEEMIDQVLEGMEASASRLAMLVNPVWSTELREQVIPDLGLTVLTQDKFTVSIIKDIPMKGRMAVRNTGTTQEQIVQVSFDPSQNYDLAKSAKGSCDGALQSIGLPACKSLPTKWRGLTGLNAVVPVTMEGQAYGMAIMALQRPKERAVLTFMTLVKGSPADATLALDDLLKRIKLN
jgi:hypothetical protein